MQDSIHVRPAVILCYGGVGKVVHCVISFTDWSGGCLDKTPVLDALPMSKVRLHTGGPYLMYTCTN